MPELPPGPRTPSIVQAWHWLRRPIELMEECAARYGDTFTLHFPFMGRRGDRPPLVFFSDPEAVREIFTGDGEDMRSGEANVSLGPLVGDNSLLLLDGPRHLRERRLMMPPFHGERMQAYGEVMREVADRVIDRWPVGQPFAIHPSMQEITLDVILRTVFGLDEGATMDRLRERITRFLAVGVERPWTLLLQIGLGPLARWGQLVRLMREIDDILFAEIARRRAAGTDGRTDVLSMLVAARDETGAPMTDQELRDEMLTLLLAGHETSSTTLCWVVNRIVREPAVVERLRAELAHVVNGGPLRPERVSELEYLDATIKETLRLNPIIPAVVRRLQRPMRIGGVDLPAGVVATPCIYLTHRRPDAWPDPTRFDPERFVGTRVSPYAFFPFGGGIRRCLGMAFSLYEMKIVLAEMLARVELRAAPGPPVRLVRRGITFAPSNGMPVVAERRAA